MPNNSYTLVSRLSDGTQLNGDSGTIGSPLALNALDLAISANGRYVAFTSYATNVPGDVDNGGVDVYLKDTLTGALSVVSVSASGANTSAVATVYSVSDDGSWVLFGSSATNLGSYGPSPIVNRSVYLKNMATGEVLDMVPEKTPAVANSSGSDGDMSGDARFVVFASTESNITGETVSGTQIFRLDRQNGAITLVSKSATGVQLGSNSDDPHISNDGRYVIFQTKAKAVAADLNTATDIYLKDTQTGELRLISVGLDGKAGGGEAAQISGNGRYVTFISGGDFTNPDPGNDVYQTQTPVQAVYRADLQTGTIAMASMGADGTLPHRRAYSATISDDGRHVLFKTDATNFDGMPELNYQGTFPNYTAGESGVWLKDMQNGTLAPIDADGNLQAAITDGLTLSGDASTVAFGLDISTPYLPPLVPASTDTNNADDVFTTSTGMVELLPGGFQTGTAGNDTFTLDVGNTTVNAGTGTDTVVLPMFPNVYEFTEPSPGHVTGHYAAYTLNLHDVERVQFGRAPLAGDDQRFQTTLALSQLVNGEAQQQLGRLTDLYLAFFGRAPDVSGLEYWQEKLLEEGRDFATISKDFAWSTEAQALFPPAASNRAFVETVYANCFGRTPDAGGWDYWTGQLDSLGSAGLNERGAFVGEVLLGAYAPSSGAQDRTLLTNRHEVALYYVNQLAVDPSEGVDAGINALLDQVNGDARTRAGAQNVIDYAFANPVTLSGILADPVLLDAIWGV